MMVYNAIMNYINLEEKAMKRANKIILLLLLVAMLFSCDEFALEPWGSTLIGLEDVNLSNWTKVYLPLNTEVGLDNKLVRFHFHVGAQGGGNIEIRKIVVNNKKSFEGATTVFDATATPMFPAPHLLDASTFPSYVTAPGTPDGKYVLSNTGYKYGGSFASSAAEVTDAQFWGFDIRSDRLGDVRVDLETPQDKIFSDSGPGKIGPTLFLINILETETAGASN